MRKDDDPMAKAARLAFVLLGGVICFASLAPAGWMPRLLWSYHLEHFAAFYLVTLSMIAARYRVRVYRSLIDVAVLATVLEALRLFIPAHQLSVAEDWAADLGGTLAAVAPFVVADFRRSFVD